MKPRARRVTLAGVGLGAALVAVLVVLNWNTMRDHVEAWWFQVTHETAKLRPGQQATMPGAPGGSFLQVLANQSGLPVLSDPDAAPVMLGDGFVPLAQLPRMLHAIGYRIVKQRFPSRAYVVVGRGDS